MDEVGGPDEQPGGELLRRVGETAKDVGLAVGAQGLVSGLIAEGVVADLVGAAAPSVLGLTAYASVRAVQRLVRRGTRVLDVTSAETGTTPDELAGTIRNSEAASELFSRVMEVAAATRLEDKIYALGKALALGVSDPAQLDEAHMLVEALAVTEAPHVLLLGQIVDTCEQWRAERLANDPTAPPEKILAPWMRRPDIEALYPPGHLPLEPVIARLTAAGLLYDPVTGGVTPGPQLVAVSPMGQRCLELLREAGNHPH